MREPEKCMVEYCGYQKPRSDKEFEFEMLGLATAIKIIEKRMADLEQSRMLASILKEQVQETEE